ncbi:hypothetical protein BANT10_03520 [Brevibacterium antiquum]|uniref:Uncharacterized protein n=2 Tax=Brevibacterium antiquum TaxID=234835 RepID=A0A2H1L1S1_9MICO|nr:hypothetical protein BANT10_03520 [Brevibacterium antiquum]SMY05422.1 hypothetical protein BANT918_03426 [Brevibacterium antiquum CNRZ 918]
MPATTTVRAGAVGSAATAIPAAIAVSKPSRAHIALVSTIGSPIGEGTDVRNWTGIGPFNALMSMEATVRTDKPTDDTNT